MDDDELEYHLCDMRDVLCSRWNDLSATIYNALVDIEKLRIVRVDDCREFERIFMTVQTVNIGPGHPKFNHEYPGFTQVLVQAHMKDGEIRTLAQFFGMTAKIHAGMFVGLFKQMDYTMADSYEN